MSLDIDVGFERKPEGLDALLKREGYILFEELKKNENPVY